MIQENETIRKVFKIIRQVMSQSNRQSFRDVTTVN